MLHLNILLETPSDYLHRRPGFHVYSTSEKEVQHMNVNFLK
jgi:hypothetical protein